MLYFNVIFRFQKGKTDTNFAFFQVLFKQSGSFIFQNKIFFPQDLQKGTIKKVCP